MRNKAAVEPALHVLHVGSGYRPLRWGGLVAYVEDLTTEQLRRGNRVSYFFSGRYFRWPRGPRLKRWSREGVEMLEVVNSPLHDHGRQPKLEVSEPAVEAIFERTLEELHPDIVHVQELAGLPSSLLEIASASGVPVVMTLQDYFPLCSTFKLLDAEDRVCLRREMGAECAANVAVELDDRPSNLLFEGTLRHEIMSQHRLNRLPPRLRRALANRAAGSWLARPSRQTPATARPPGPDDFQRRRDANIARLNRVDRLLAMSNRVAEIYAELGVEAERLQTMHLTLGHIEKLTPRRASISAPLRFATLGGGESTAKGSALLLQAVMRVSREVGDNFKVLAFGKYSPSFEAAATQTDAIELRGPYRPADLNDLLEEVDVGIMPSIWEEAYGYAGVEFIAKGIPVIANKIGGMVDYVREGETGWLNRSCTGEELGSILAELAAAPDRVAEMSRTTAAARERLVIPMARHADAMQGVYQEVIGDAPRPWVTERRSPSGPRRPQGSQLPKR